MAYTKQTWNTGDIITAEKLNHIEDGLEELLGGGGYEISNPILTITALSNMELYINRVDNDGYLCYEAVTIGGGDSVSLLVCYDDDADSFAFWVEVGTYLASNEVNCTYNDSYVYITDPTQNASITLEEGEG